MTAGSKDKGRHKYICRGLFNQPVRFPSTLRHGVRVLCDLDVNGVMINIKRMS